jgi:formylmethanofuran dehydrogenase subunit E
MLRETGFFILYPERTYKEVAMIDAKEYLEAGLNLHGHKCPAMPLGLRAGMAAMNRLGVERSMDKELAAVVELGDDHCSHCFADGIQTVTGCTFGKGNLRKMGYGKFGVTLVDRKSGQAVRVVPRAEAQARMKETPFFLEYRGKGVPASRVPDNVVDPLIRQVMDAPEDAILHVGRPFPMNGKHPSETFASFVCDLCGETVVEKYGRIVGGQKVCIPCQEKALAEE